MVTTGPNFSQFKPQDASSSPFNFNNQGTPGNISRPDPQEIITRFDNDGVTGLSIDEFKEAGKELASKVGMDSSKLDNDRSEDVFARLDTDDSNSLDARELENLPRLMMQYAMKNNGGDSGFNNSGFNLTKGFNQV
ncbi:MAG: hypothetical protein QNJ31_03665 [Candidatus Caenarcaniphilales bacterium]|nr:hypothetical protein [Candidatus Caenarcaniphilales bacterium]